MHTLPIHQPRAPDAPPLSAELLSHLAGLLADGRPLHVSMSAAGVCLTLSVAPVRTPQPHAPSPCEADVVTIIRERGRRMTTEEVKRVLQTRNQVHGDSTVTKALADLCRRHGMLTNGRDGRGRGYGLAEWGEPGQGENDS